MSHPQGGLLRGPFGHVKKQVEAKLGRCWVCIRSSGIGTVLSWGAVAAVSFVWPNRLLLLGTVLVAAAFTRGAGTLGVRHWNPDETFDRVDRLSSKIAGQRASQSPDSRVILGGTEASATPGQLGPRRGDDASAR